MKTLLLASILMVSTAFANVSIPKGEMEKRVAAEISDLLGFTEIDASYPNALFKCAEDKETGAFDYFTKVRDYLKSDEFTSKSEFDKEGDIFTLCLAVKMVCDKQLREAGIDL
ncbi:MAG: hypothetical protein A2381_20235 [Bdellovibrionales bacterium RIFOXYB1_FULL_37_110]|nr:MAG: hypothetical protein A2181_03870 [Bdellovibrionales bacterium RIFOXYA1_FULL_38_20]OFZ51065.1 MAG: hypothetical protein A2417_20020 [Bdellovibrionales bacterium RIFOXYC1_FULL_37_79]OFZ60277.1 MAG: hypothetical protein A2381_20235 [Bdellovibrionales bacterium RIFOXYB1_FULL_37_110]OFZ63272.1 MAG: hypothetical protein A2577_01550 [Bdellovibrionales bacterium RIFOXYD1_FULL_36_51]